MSCIFCEIANRQRPAQMVYEDETAVAFHDINPQAPVHIVVIPREHIAEPLDFDAGNEQIAGHLISVAAQVAQQEGLAATGYRLVMNQGRDGGASCASCAFARTGRATIGLAAGITSPFEEWHCEQRAAIMPLYCGASGQSRGVE